MKIRIFSGVIALALLLITQTFAHAADVKEWTFLVFLNANNNLDSYSDLNMKEMEKVGSTDKVNIVVQWASLASGTTKRILVKKSTNPNAVTSPVVQDIGRVDMGDTRTLVDFVAWAAKNYPAKKYFLNIWDHGSGWHGLRVQGGIHASDISYDENTGNMITTKQLGEAIGNISKILGQKLDLYGSDACLMAMAEIAGEMQNSLDVYAGSQEVEPAEGWPYDAFLAKLVAKPTMDARELASNLTHDYVKSYQGGSHGTKDVTFSAFDMKNYAAFVAAMKDFEKEFEAAAPTKKAQMLQVAENSQGFEVYDYKDLLHFLNKLDSTNAISRGTRANLEAAAKKFLIANDVTSKYSNAKGLSIWLPTDSYYYDSYKQAYEDLQFARETQWGSALQQLLRQ